MRKAGSSRLADFIVTRFHRLDIFSTLGQYFDHLEQSGLDKSRYYPTNASPDAESERDLRLLTQLQTEIESATNDLFARFKSIKWPPPQSFGTAFCTLFDYLTQNHPILRVMGLRELIRAMHGELRKSADTISAPDVVMFALNDLSTLAVCSEQLRALGAMCLLTVDN